MENLEPSLKWEINKNEGVCGHVLIKYPTGGKLLTSCGHWIELVKLHVSEDTLFKVAREGYGAAYCQRVKVELDNCSSKAERKQVCQKQAARMVQSAAPSAYCKGYGHY